MAKSPLFREIPGAPGYEITKDARVRCWWSIPESTLPLEAREPLREPRELKPMKISRGRARVFQVRRPDGTRWTIPRGRAVLCAWVGPPGEGQCARHYNRDLLDDRLENLYWGEPPGFESWAVDEDDVMATANLPALRAAKALGVSKVCIYANRKKFGLPLCGFADYRRKHGKPHPVEKRFGDRPPWSRPS